MRRNAAILVFLTLLVTPLLCLAGEEEGAAYLGVRGQKMTDLIADAFGLDEAAGILLSNVADESPAEKAGLRRGDVLLRWNGETIRSPRGLIRLIRDAEPGEKIDIEYVRRGEPGKARIVLGERESREERGEHGRREWRGGKRRRPSARIGAEVRDLDADLAPYFELSAGSGALVTDVREDGPAEEAGVRAGDVIVRLGETEIRSAADLRGALADRDPGEETEIELIRKGEKEIVVVELGARHSRFPRLREFRFPKVDWGRFRGAEDRLEREMERLERELERLREKIDEKLDE